MSMLESHSASADAQRMRAERCGFASLRARRGQRGHWNSTHQVRAANGDEQRFNNALAQLGRCFEIGVLVEREVFERRLIEDAAILGVRVKDKRP